MNKIYKVIWSRVKNCYVVTNEFAKTHGKTATKAMTAAVMASVIAGVSSPVLAAPWGEELGQDTVANNTYSISTGSGSIAIGKGAVATGNNYTAEQLQTALKDAKDKQAELEKATNEYNQAQNEYAKAKADFDANNEVYAAVEAAKARMDAIQNEINNTYKPAADAANADYTAKKDAYETAYNDFKNRLEYIKVIDFNLADVNTDAGLTQLATDLKMNTEQGTPFDQPIQFYKDYIQNYIKAKGDLRVNKKAAGALDNSSYSRFWGETYDSSFRFLSAFDSNFNYFNSELISEVSSNSSVVSTVPRICHFIPSNDDIRHDSTSIVTTENYSKVIANLKIQTGQYLAEYNHFVDSAVSLGVFPVSDGAALKEEYKRILDRNTNYYLKSIDVLHEQYLYETTHDLTHLSKKEQLVREIENTYFVDGDLSLAYDYDVSGDNPGVFRDIYTKWYKEKIKDCEDGVNVTLKMVEDGLGNDIKDKKAAYDAATAAKEQADKNLADQQAALKNAKPTPEQEAEAAKSEEKAKQLEDTKNKLAADKEALEKAKDDISKLVKISDIGENGIAFGTNALTSGKNAVGIGTSAVVTGEEAIGIGKDSVIAGKKATSVGANNKVSGANSTAVGRDITITGEDSIAIGTGHTVTGSHSGAFGDPTILNADNSYAVGNNGTIGTGSENSFLFGNDSTIGDNGHHNFVLGNNSEAKDDVSNSFVLGNRSYATHSNTVVIGSHAIASANGSVALGQDSVASEAHTVSLGHKGTDMSPENTSYGEDLVRRIVNVGAGTSATDAATVAQTATLSSKDNTVTITETINENGSKNYDLHSEGTTYSAGNGISITSEGVISTVVNGTIASDDDNAVSGKVVYAELRPVDGNYVKEAYTTAANLTALDTQAKANATAISQLGDDKANVSLDNLSDAGKTVLQTAAKDAVKVADGSNTTVTSEVDASGNISYKVTANAMGTVADADTGLVSGKTVYDEVRPADGTYVKKAETTAANLKALDTQTKANTDAIAGLGDSKAGVGLENITTAGENKIKEVMREGMDGKANIDASNITKSVWNTVLGTGAVATDNTELVTGKTVYTEVRPADGNFVKTDNTTAANLTALDTKVQEALTGVSGLGDNKANVGLDNLSDAGKTVIQQSAQSAVKVVDGENTTVTSEKDAAGNVSYKVKANADGTVTEGNTGLVSGGSVYNAITEGNKNAVQYDGDDHNTITLSGTGEDGTKITHLADGSLDKDSTDAVNGGQFYDYMQAVNQLLEGKSDANANNVGANAAVDNSEAWGSALGTGTVEKNNGKLVTGGRMFDELRPTDGEFVKQSNTTAANLLALDNEVALKANQSLDNINEDGKTVIKDLAKGAVKVVDGDNTTVSFVTDPDGNVSYKVKANATGEVAANNTGLVDGGTVYNAIKGLATEAALADKANTGLDNLSDAGKTTVKDLAKEAVKVKAGSNITVATDADGYTVGVKANGAVAVGDTGLLNGGALHAELRPTDGKYVKKSNTTAGNLTALDSQVQANTNKIDAMEQVIGDVSGKANADASNVAEHSAKWGAAIGTGEVAEGNGELVTGGTVFGAIDGAKTELQSEINKKADADLKNLSDQGKGVVRNLAKGAVKVEGKGVAIVTSAEKGDATVYTVDVKKDGKVEAGNDGIVTGGTVHDALQAATAGVNTALNGKADVGLTNLSEEGKQTIRDAVKDDLAGKADTGLSNLTEDGKNVIRDTMKNDLDKKADKDAGNIEVSKWASKLGNGEVKAGDKGLVNGDTVFEALKEVNGTDLIDEKDGAIRIGAKDKYDGLNTVDLSKSDGKGRVLTGVVTDPQRGDSAANVGYVNGVAGILQDNMNRGFQTMDGRINKAGARSAALAGLHPVDADSDQKWNVAIGYGNFKGENAAAAGIFYKPDDRFMINVSSTLQDQENMVSAGMSFALDKGSGLSSRRALNNKVNKLEDALKQVIAANNAMVQELNALKGQQMALNGMTKEFPDVPQNHWAHKAVTNLHGSDIVQGYPDGEFKGNRSMTRYEYAEMLYNAITAGKKVPAEMRREYAKELAEVKKARG